jgi:hypothetical protein
MSFFHSPRIVTKNLLHYVDFANPNCYTSGSAETPVVSGFSTSSDNPVTNLATGEIGYVSYYAPSPTSNFDEWPEPTTEALGGMKFNRATNTSIGSLVYNELQNAPTFPFSLGSWFKPIDASLENSNSTDQTIISSVAAAGGSFFTIATDVSGSDCIVTKRFDFEPGREVTKSDVFLTGSFYQVHVNFPNNQLVEVYLNGSYLTQSSTLSVNLTSSLTRVHLGNLRTGGPEPYNNSEHTIYQGYVYDDVLTEREILQNFNAHRGRYGI